MAEARRGKAFERCRELAEAGDSLERVAETVEAIGFAGDARPVLLVFLDGVSSLLERPVSLALKGPSATGKSYIVKTGLRFILCVLCIPTNVARRSNRARGARCGRT